MAALHAILDLELHVVAQVVEAELVVGAVGDVGGVGGAALFVAQVVDNDADGEAEELVDLAHPLGVALGQVVVHRDHVNAVPGKRVEVAGERRHEGFAFTGSHFGNLALVQDHAADQLHVEVAHLHGAPAGFADDGEGFGQNFVECGAFGSVDFVFACRCLPGERRCGRGTRLVLARNCSSESCFVSSSRALMVATTGHSFLMMRSFEVPKILVSTLSIKTKISVYQCKWRGCMGGSAQAQAEQASAE